MPFQLIFLSAIHDDEEPLPFVVGPETTPTEVQSILMAFFGQAMETMVLVCPRMSKQIHLLVPLEDSLARQGLVDNDQILVGTSATFQNPSHGTAGGGRRRRRRAAQASYFDGMSLYEILSANPDDYYNLGMLFRHNPRAFAQLDLNRPELGRKVRNSATDDEAIEHIRVWLCDMAFENTMDKINQDTMKARLAKDPNDEEAKKFCEDLTNQELVAQSYMDMIEHYPEGHVMNRVLMLHIRVDINNTPISAFVDTGAQNSIMSSALARRCDIFRMVDTRFRSVLMGVGQRESYGRIHMCAIKIQGQFFYFSLTVADLSDTGPELIIGLDMLKRHRCLVDLTSGSLTFGHGAEAICVPFLHENELDVRHGGTLGFDPDAEEEHGGGLMPSVLDGGEDDMRKTSEAVSSASAQEEQSDVKQVKRRKTHISQNSGKCILKASVYEMKYGWIAVEFSGIVDGTIGHTCHIPEQIRE